MIAHGHQEVDLRDNYTQRQVKLYYTQALRRDALARADHLDDLSLVFTGKTHPGSDKIRESYKA